MNTRATLKDVAKEAGVTAATVSYVINNTPGQTIRPETRKRVLDAVEKLKYAPNAHARTLRSQQSPCIGLVIKKNLAVPRFSQMAYGIQTRLEKDGHNVLLFSNTIGKLNIADYVEAYLAGRISGIIFIATENEGPDSKSIQLLTVKKAPLVVFDSQTQADDYSTVDFDYRSGASLITKNVISRGFEHVVYIEPTINTAQENLRELGVCETCKQNSISFDIYKMPITLDNLELWDARYSVGDTEDGLNLNKVFLERVKEILDKTPDNSSIISSWATWTHYFRKTETERFSKKQLIYAELANNGESWLAADIYTRLPNYEAGVYCAEEILNLIKGDAPSSRLIKLSNVIEIA